MRCRNRTTVPSRYSQCLASGLHAWRWARSCMLQPVPVSLRAKCFRLPHQALECNSGAMVQQRPPAKGSTVQHSMCAPFHNTPTYVAPGSLHPGAWPAINVPKFLVSGHDTLQMRMQCHYKRSKGASNCINRAPKHAVYTAHGSRALMGCNNW